MADTKLSALTATTTLTDDDEFYVNDGGTSKKITKANLDDAIVTTANVTAAGALMDSEVDADIKTLSLPASTTISAFGATLIDDADASAARTTLGVDAAGTDNSTDVTMTYSMSPEVDYVTISGQVITVNAVDLAADVTGNLPVSNLNGGSGASSSSFWRGDGTWAVPAGSGDVSKVGTPVDDQVGVWTGDGTIEGTSGLTYDGSAFGVTGNITVTGTVDGVDIATRDHDAVTLVDGVSPGLDYITLSGQAITVNAVDLAADVTGNLPAASVSSLPTEIMVACSDETTDLTTGTAKITFRMPFAMTLTEVRASVTTAPTGSTLIVDINEKVGTPSPDVPTSILSTKITIDAGEFSSETAATAPVISDSALADDAEITIDIDQIGSSVAGAGLKVTLIGTRA